LDIGYSLLDIGYWIFKRGENPFSDKNIDFKYKKELNEGKGFVKI
jgi:hypothetical protein